MYLWIGRNCHPNFLTQVLGVPNYAAVPDNLVGNFTLQQSHLKPPTPKKPSFLLLWSFFTPPFSLKLVSSNTLF